MQINVGAKQWIGMAMLLLVCAFYGLLISPIGDKANATDTRKVAAGERVTVRTISIVPGKGWAPPAGKAVLLSLQAEGATLNMFDPEPTRGSVSETVTKEADSFVSDNSAHYSVGKPVTYKTTSGLDVATLLVTSPQENTLHIAVSDGKQTVIGLVDGNAKAWGAIRQGLKPMLMSIEFRTAKEAS